MPPTLPPDLEAFTREHLPASEVNASMDEALRQAERQLLILRLNAAMKHGTPAGKQIVQEIADHVRGMRTMKAWIDANRPPEEPKDPADPQEPATDPGE